MLRSWLWIVCAILGFSCKTTSPDSSKLKAWELQGNRDAAKAYIIKTIVEHYPDVQESEPALAEFAQALQEAKTDQTLSADYVLHELWLKSQGKQPSNQLSPIENYIVQEWISHTNYLFVRSHEANKLEFLNP